MLVTIATFSFPHEAHLAKAQLDASGIPSFIADEHTINMQWLYSNAMGGVRLQVPAAFVAEAQALLDEPAEILDDAALEADPEWEHEPEHKPDAPRCAQCGGRLGPPYIAGKRPAIISWILLGFPAWPINRVRQCVVCRQTTRAS